MTKALTVKEFAETMQISLPTAYNLLYSENAPAFIRVGRAIRIPVSALDEWLASFSERGR